jgi:hypothetical protein
MTDHGWLDHHDHGDGDNDDGDAGFHHDEPVQFDDVEHPPPPEHDYFEDVHHDHDVLAPEEDGHEVTPYEHHTEFTDSGEVAHEDAATVVEPETVFPPPVDVGPLPEPVDGFPWIDTGSLGLVDPATVHTADVDPVDPHELAEYAGEDLPPGVDPWAALADSEDPATANLARWWAENQQ